MCVCLSSAGQSLPGLPEHFSWKTLHYHLTCFLQVNFAKMMRRRHSFNPQSLPTVSVFSPEFNGSSGGNLLSPGGGGCRNSLTPEPGSPSIPGIPGPIPGGRCRSPMPVGRCKSPQPPNIARCKSPQPMVCYFHVFYCLRLQYRIAHKILFHLDNKIPHL